MKLIEKLKNADWWNLNFWLPVIGVTIAVLMYFSAASDERFSYGTVTADEDRIFRIIYTDLKGYMVEYHTFEIKRNAYSVSFINREVSTRHDKSEADYMPVTLYGSIRIEERIHQGGMK